MVGSAIMIMHKNVKRLKHQQICMHKLAQHRTQKQKSPSTSCIFEQVLDRITTIKRLFGLLRKNLQQQIYK